MRLVTDESKPVTDASLANQYRYRLFLWMSYSAYFDMGGIADHTVSWFDTNLALVILR